jgi:hypothetical protein
MATTPPVCDEQTGGFVCVVLTTPLPKDRRAALAASLRGALATKQSILPRKESMDRFASLAMTL